MTNRFCDTEIWEKDWFLDLNTKQKLLVKFLFDKCDCAGFYKISWNLLKVFFNDVEITREDFEKIRQVKFVEDNLIFIEDFALFQCKVPSFDKLNPNNNAHKGVLKLLEKYNIYSAPKEGLTSPFDGAQEKEKEKENNTTISKQVNSSFLATSFLLKNDEKLYGEYRNVCLTKDQYGKLLSMCASEKLLNELIYSFSIQIEVGKERPYTAELPNAHYERLKSYYNYRKKNPEKFQEKEKRPYDKKYVPFILSKEDEEDSKKAMQRVRKELNSKGFGRRIPDV